LIPPFLRHRWVAFLAVIVLVPAVMLGSYGFYLADSENLLPWQEDPTRIPITPFAGIDGLTPIAFPTRTPDAAAATTAIAVPATPTAE
jgi:hypothetical protein